MLTPARSSEVRLATYSEIQRDLWILGSDRTKTGRMHRISLSHEALSVVSLANQSEDQTVLFPSATGNPLSNAAMAQFMKR